MLDSQLDGDFLVITAATNAIALDEERTGNGREGWSRNSFGAEPEEQYKLFV